MGAKKTRQTKIIVVEFVTTAASDIPGVRYKACRVRVAIVSFERRDVTRLIEKFRLQHSKLMQEVNPGFVIETRALLKDTIRVHFAVAENQEIQEDEKR